MGWTIIINLESRLVASGNYYTTTTTTTTTTTFLFSNCIATIANSTIATLAALNYQIEMTLKFSC